MIDRTVNRNGRYRNAALFYCHIDSSKAETRPDITQTTPAVVTGVANAVTLVLHDQTRGGKHRIRMLLKRA